ncbi:MAG: S-methyl-5-thioribose-phosphate isomerase, partial [Bacilli bacterium]|nr:S-methyl-5-thioribose-phosphate isomerase [Bacilli bacterium]
PEGVKALHPAFDVTPHELITGIITEYGVIHEPSVERIETFFEQRRSIL